MMGSRYIARLVAALPMPPLLYRLCNRYVELHDNDNNGDMRTNGEFRWLSQVLPQCEVIFDVGANVGDWTLQALDLNPGMEVHCFEPSGDTFGLLASRVTTGGEKKPILNQLALGASRGSASLHVFAEAAGSNSLYRREGLTEAQATTEEVAVGTIDDYCEAHQVERVDLLKLDVEGHELAVLQGASFMLSQGRVARIQFEYGGTYIDARILLKDVYELLVSHDYRLFKLHPRGPHEVCQYDQRLETYKYQNWIALR
jgi:FkbM family methyltransferase